MSATHAFWSQPHASKQRHICIVTETYPPEINGVARTLAHLVEGLRTQGHAVSVAVHANSSLIIPVTVVIPTRGHSTFSEKRSRFQEKSRRPHGPVIVPKALRVGPRASRSEASKHRGWSHCATARTVLLGSGFRLLGGSNATNGRVSGAAYPALHTSLNSRKAGARHYGSLRCIDTMLTS